MVRVRHIVEREYRGTIISRERDMLRIRWDDGRELFHTISEIELIPDKIE